MKVKVKLQNFDLLPDQETTDREEEQIFALLSEVVPALTDRCDNKMQTRAYIRNNIHRKEPAPTGEHAITAKDDVFLTALYSVLMDERYKLGYAMNGLRKEIQSRKLRLDLYDVISDAAVSCAQTFDIDEIREKAKNIPDLYERMLYVCDKYDEIQLLNKDEFDGDEYDDLVRPLGTQLKFLCDATRRLLEFAKERAKEQAAQAALENSEFLEIRPKKNSKKPCATPKKPAASKTDSEKPLQFSGKTTPRIQKKILNFLHQYVGYKPGVDELVYVAAAMDSGYLLRPAFRYFVQEFPTYKGKDSVYGGCLGSTGILLQDKRSVKHKEAISAIVKELKSKLK